MRRALIIDDDVQTLALTKRWLQAAGYEVVTSSDFLDGRAQLRACLPDVMIADVRLGAFNGLQLGLLARDRFPEVRVVIVSGWDDPVIRRDADELGAVYLQKPFSPEELLSAIGFDDMSESYGPAQETWWREREWF
jgi:two-component system, response regulator YesN